MNPLSRHPRTAFIPEKYKQWRDTYIDPQTDILEGIEHLTDVQLQDAYQAALPGLTAERLNPKSPEFDGSFHLAVGMIIGNMYKRGLNIPHRIWPMV